MPRLLGHLAVSVCTPTCASAPQNPSSYTGGMIRLLPRVKGMASGQSKVREEGVTGVAKGSKRISNKMEVKIQGVLAGLKKMGRALREPLPMVMLEG